MSRVARQWAANDEYAIAAGQFLFALLRVENAVSICIGFAVYPHALPSDDDVTSFLETFVLPVAAGEKLRILHQLMKSSTNASAAKSLKAALASVDKLIEMRNKIVHYLPKWGDPGDDARVGGKVVRLNELRSSTQQASDLSTTILARGLLTFGGPIPH